MKKIASIMLVLVLCITANFNTSIAAANSLPEEVDIFKQQLEEVSDYLNRHMDAIDLIEQTIEYDIPLSDGTTAQYSITLTPIEEKTPGTRSVSIFDAKVGGWYFDSRADFPLHGEFTVRTIVEITEVPTEPGRSPRFTAYGGTVTAIPFQYTTVTGSSAQTYEILNSLIYETSGYVGYMLYQIPLNIYFTQEISFVDNVENYDKIMLIFNYEA